MTPKLRYVPEGAALQSAAAPWGGPFGSCLMNLVNPEPGQPALTIDTLLIIRINTDMAHLGKEL